jgi:hypothetical protein
VRTSHLAYLLKNCQDISGLLTINYVGRVCNMQVTNDIIILHIDANQVRLIQCLFMKHNYLYHCQNFKTKCRVSTMNALREREVSELIGLFNFFGNNKYQYKEIAVSCSKAVLCHIQ